MRLIKTSELPSSCRDFLDRDLDGLFTNKPKRRRRRRKRQRNKLRRIEALARESFVFELFGDSIS